MFPRFVRYITTACWEHSTRAAVCVPVSLLLHHEELSEKWLIFAQCKFV